MTAHDVAEIDAEARVVLSETGRIKMSWKRSLVFGAIIAAIVAGYRVYSELAGPRFDERLQKFEADMKKSLPQKVDDLTTLVDVKYGRTKTDYWFVLDTKDGMPDPREIERHVTTGACLNGEIARTIREKGYTYEYHYANKERAFVANFTIKCP